MASGNGPDRVMRTFEATFSADSIDLPGIASVAADAKGTVMFAHGSGSGRHSPRNRWVAERLHRVGMVTVLFDLLSEEESADRTNVFDIELLTRRLGAATDATLASDWAAGLRIGYFGASTGAAAALSAAAGRDDISAVVSRGGRPDLAGDLLPSVGAPTLLIVGGADREVLALNRAAMAQLPGPAEIRVIPGATHLFEEPGALAAVADLAAAWFGRYLSG
jgi:pimeloyl-ACP methyl ester carboxylesterase